jgi:hypothetical protein
VRRICFYHAGCPDGFGAAWAVWRAWGDEGSYRPHGHDDGLRAADYLGDEVVFVDIAPPNDLLDDLLSAAARVVVLDHHVSSLKRFESDSALVSAARDRRQDVIFKLDHSGAVLAWQHFGGEEPVPQLLLYVEDQDLWNWALPRSEEVNAAIASYPRRFEVWDELAQRPIEELAREGEPILRANRQEVERQLTHSHPVQLGERLVEAVNATSHRSLLGHELSARAAHGEALGCVYRLHGGRVDVSLYSIGELDVSKLAARHGGGGHRNAAGFSVPLRVWLEEFIPRSTRRG